MKKIFFLIIITFCSCSKTNNTPEVAVLRIGNSSLTNAFASGDISEQSE